MSSTRRYITDEQGERIGVLLDLDEYQQLTRLSPPDSEILVGLSEAESRSALDGRALVCGRLIFGWHFPFRVAQLRDARALYGRDRWGCSGKPDGVTV